MDPGDVGFGLVHRAAREGGSLAQEAFQRRGPALASGLIGRRLGGSRREVPARGSPERGVKGQRSKNQPWKKRC